MADWMRWMALFLAILGLLAVVWAMFLLRLEEERFERMSDEVKRRGHVPPKPIPSPAPRKVYGDGAAE